MRPKTGDYIRVEEVDELGRWRTIGEGVVKKPNRKKPRTITIVDVLGEDFRFPYPHPRYRVTDRPQPRVQRPGSGGRTGGDRKISAQKARALMDSAGLRGRALPRMGYLVKLDDEMSQWIDNRSGQYFHVVWGDLIKPDWVGNPARHDWDVIDSMARTLFVEAWANYVEEEHPEETKHWGGQDLMDLAPETPNSASLVAVELYDAITDLNGKGSIEATVERLDADPDLLGHYLVMESLGHGVAWTDDHEPHNLELPDIETGWDGEELWVSGL